MLVLIIARSNRATLSIKDESEFASSLFSCIQDSCLLLNTQLNAETDRHIVQSFGSSLYSLIHCLYIPCISLISSSVFPLYYIPICQDMFLFQSLAYSLSCPVYTYYLTMKGDTRAGRTITKFPCPSHIFSSDPPQNSRPFKNIFLSVSNP